MKKIILLMSVSALVILLFANFGDGKGGKYPGGAPAGYTGSPFDGKDCSGCHGGTSTAVTGWITSNIPGTGFTAGHSYSITVTIPGTGSENKGFEVSPQKPDGTLLGTLVAGTGSKLVGTNNAYITHSAGMSANPGVWNFTWTAPASGSGTVTFYGAFVDGFSNIYHSTMTVNESTQGISDLGKNSGIEIFPNPVKDKLNFSMMLSNSGHVTVSLLDLTGKLVLNLMDEEKNAGEVKGSCAINGAIKPGIYLVKINNGISGPRVEKVVIE